MPTTFIIPDYTIGNSADCQTQSIGVLQGLDQALQALQPAPNATTVQFNDTIIITDGVNTNTITATSSSGSVASVDITDTNTSAVYYPTFVDSAGSAKVLRADIGTTPFSINPNTGDFNVGTTLKLTQSELAIGKSSGTSQGSNSIAIGLNAGVSQSTNCVAIGGLSGLSQANASVAIGYRAGGITQGLYSIAVGLDAGKNQLADAVAIGRNAGQGTSTVQGSNSIAIGLNAGVASQTAGSICLNASGVALNPNQAGCFIRPLRGVALGLGVGVVYYDTATYELQYSTT